MSQSMKITSAGDSVVKNNTSFTVGEMTFDLTNVGNSMVSV